MAEKKYLDSGGLTTLVSNIKSKVETITNQLDNKKATKDELASAESRITAAEKDIDAAEVLLQSISSKLGGISSGAEVNQNAFSNVKVGSTTVAADAKQDTLELVAGTNVTISADAATDKISISAKDTTYGEATTSAAGLMSASDKVKVNAIDAISSEVEINPQVVGGQVLAYVGNGYYVTNASNGSTVSTTATLNNMYEACILSVSVGEKYVIQAVGGSSPRVWCFTDSSYKIIHKCEVSNLNCSGTSISNNPAIIIVPQNATRLLLNNTKNSNYEFKITKLIDGLDNGTARNPFMAHITGTASNAIAITDPRFELKVGAELNIISDTNTSVKTLNVNGTGDVPFYYPSSTNTYQTFTVVKARPYKIFYNGYGWVISSPYVTYSNTSFCNIYPETATTRKSVSAYSSYPACNTIWLYNSSGWNDGSNGRIIIKFNIDVIDNDYICLYHYTNTSSTTAVGPTTAQYVRPLYFRGSPIKAGVIKAGDIVTLSKMSNDKNNAAKQYYDVLSIDRCNDNAWGTTSNNTSALKISGESKTVSLSGHKHTKAEITDFPTIPTALKNPKALKFGSKTYDGSAEAEITAADLGLSSALKYHGTTTTAISDGSTTNPIVIGGSNHTATQGCVVAYGKKEFVWTGSAWEELGNEGNYKVVQTAVSSPSASGSTTAFIDTISQDTNGKITVTKKNVSFPSLASYVTGPGSSTVNHVAVFTDATGKVIGDSGYTIAKSVPSNAVFTDTNTKVTSADNHYTPTENTDAAISASGGSATNITGTGGKLNVVTGLKRDSKGHIVGVTSANIYSTDNNSTYANYSFGNGYATCATAEATTAKVATYQYYSLATGGIVAVKFTYAVPANSTLNINSKGAKSIYYNNAAITAGVIGAGDIATFVYDGTNYVLLAVDNIMTAAEKTKLSGIASGATANKGTVTSVATGVGLTGGSITTSGTIKCNLNSETSLGTIGSTSKLYAVGVDANNKLCVNVPWSDTNTDTKGQNIVGASATATANAVATNGNVWLNHIEGSSVKSKHNIVGSNNVSVTSDANGKITITGPTLPTLSSLGAAASSHTHTKSEITDFPSIPTSSTVSGWGFTKNAGTVTSIIPGTGLTGASSDSAITSSGTINLKNAATGEIGGIKVGTVNSSVVTTKTEGSNYYPVNIDSNGKGYVALPTWSNNSGTITGATAGKGLTGGGTSGSVTLNVGAGTGISVGNDAVSCNLNSTTSLGTIGTTSKLYAVGVDANNKLCVNVPWSDTNTDTKVTSAANHYTPTENTDAAISASGGSATNITGTSGKLNVVTGLKRDAKGHIVGVTSANIYSTDNNTTYGLANLESNGLMSATTYTAMAENTAISSLGDISFETVSDEDGVSVFATQGYTRINYTNYEGDYIEQAVVGTIDIPAATTAKAGVMTANDKSKLDGIATGANKYTLPTATSSTLGGVKIGSNISVSSGTISLSKSNVTSALGYTPPTTNTTYSVATKSTDGLLSKSIYSRMMGPSGWIINDFQDDPISITQAADNVKLNFNLSANRTKLGDGDTDDDNTVSTGSTTIPVATTSKAGVMSAADKMKFDQPFTGLVDGKGETVTMTSSPIRENNVSINEYLNLSLRALPGISVAFATYKSNAAVVPPYLYKQAQRCALVLDRSQLNLIDYPTITWKTSTISGYGTPWEPEQDGYSLIYIPGGYQSITFKHTGEDYNISVVGVHPSKYGGGYIFNGEWQYANEARTITLNNSALYVILQAKKVDNSNIDPKLDVLSELGISITLNRSDNNICRGFVLDDGTQVYPVFKSAQNNDFNRICYYTNLSGTAAKPQLGDILDCLSAYCYRLDDGYYKIIVQDPSNTGKKYGVFDVMKCLNLEVQDYNEYILDVTAMINLNTIQDAGNLEFGHIYGRIYAEVDMAGAFSIRSMSDNQWVYER